MRGYLFTRGGGVGVVDRNGDIAPRDAKRTFPTFTVPLGSA